MTRDEKVRLAFVEGRHAFKSGRPINCKFWPYRTPQYTRKAWRQGWLYQEAIAQGRVSKFNKETR